MIGTRISFKFESQPLRDRVKTREGHGNEGMVREEQRKRNQLSITACDCSGLGPGIGVVFKFVVVDA